MSQPNGLEAKQAELLHSLCGPTVMQSLSTELLCQVLAYLPLTRAKVRLGLVAKAWNKALHQPVSHEIRDEDEEEPLCRLSWPLLRLQPIARDVNRLRAGGLEHIQELILDAERQGYSTLQSTVNNSPERFPKLKRVYFDSRAPTRIDYSNTGIESVSFSLTVSDIKKMQQLALPEGCRVNLTMCVDLAERWDHPILAPYLTYLRLAVTIDAEHCVFDLSKLACYSRLTELTVLVDIYYSDYGIEDEDEDADIVFDILFDGLEQMQYQKKLYIQTVKIHLQFERGPRVYACLPDAWVSSNSGGVLTLQARDAKVGIEQT